MSVPFEIEVSGSRPEWLQARGQPRYGVVSGQLRSAGWGVVFVEGVDSAVRDALGPYGKVSV